MFVYSTVVVCIRTIDVDCAEFGGPHAHELAHHQLDVALAVERHRVGRLDCQVEPAEAILRRRVVNVRLVYYFLLLILIL